MPATTHESEDTTIRRRLKARGSIDVLEEDAKNDYQLKDIAPSDEELKERGRDDSDQMDDIQCSICEAINGERNEPYDDRNDIRQCRHCNEQLCTNCKWLEACSTCNFQVCGGCMKQHADACSGNRAKRHREEAVRRKKPRNAELRMQRKTRLG